MAVIKRKQKTPGITFRSVLAYNGELEQDLMDQGEQLVTRFRDLIGTRFTTYSNYIQYYIQYYVQYYIQYSTQYSTHQKKFIGLRITSRSDLGLLDQDSAINNLSSYALSDVEKLAQSKDLKVCLRPRKLNTGTYVADFELLFRDRSRHHFNDSPEKELYSILYFK